MHRFGNADMHRGTDRSLFSNTVVEVLAQHNRLRSGYVDHADAIPLEEEEAGLAQLSPLIASAPLARPREHTLPAFQAIVRDAFARHAIPETGGMDVGSGATGYMVAKLLPPTAQKSWLQLELSPDAVAMNRAANPGKQVMTGSYHRLTRMGLADTVPVITGLSSLDATAHIDHAVEEIRQALKVGGYLLHVQDTRPGMTLAHAELKHMGAASPYHLVRVEDPNAKPNDVLLYRHGLQGFDVIELFRRRIGRALTGNGGYELVENAWMTAMTPGATPGMNKHCELGLMVGLQSDGASFDTASAVVTVARRVK